jgi:hypothetical protein
MLLDSTFYFQVFYLFYAGCGLVVATGPERNGFAKKDIIRCVHTQYDLRSFSLDRKRK